MVSLGFAEDAVVAVAEVLVSEGCDFSVVAVALLVSAVVVVSWGTVVVSLEAVSYTHLTLPTIA